MKFNVNKLLLVATVLLVVSCSKDNMNDEKMTSNDSSEIVIPEDKQLEVEILELINDYRIENGLSALSTSLDIIKSQTAIHTDYMISNSKISHDNFNQRQAFLENYGAITVAENVAFGYFNAEDVLNAWLNSPGHKRNIEGDFTHFQITAEKDDRGIWFFTNIFIKK